jgi:predicted TIM-barrel fold metal-dependent hydrolase
MLPEIASYASNLEARMPRLQRAVSLHAQLGQSRVDMSMVNWPEEKLEAHTASLVAQVRRLTPRPHAPRARISTLRPLPCAVHLRP